MNWSIVVLLLKKINQEFCFNQFDVFIVGNIPLRQLVYRVHKLPDSMLPLVWDFGQLSTEAEVLYIAQIVNRYVSKY